MGEQYHSDRAECLFLRCLASLGLARFAPFLRPLVNLQLWDAYYFLCEFAEAFGGFFAFSAFDFFSHFDFVFLLLSAKDTSRLTAFLDSAKRKSQPFPASIGGFFNFELNTLLQCCGPAPLI